MCTNSFETETPPNACSELDALLKEVVEKVRASLHFDQISLDKCLSVITADRSVARSEDELFGRAFSILLDDADHLRVEERDSRALIILKSALEQARRGSWENLQLEPLGQESEPLNTSNHPVWIVGDGVKERILFVDHVWDTRSPSFAERRCRLMALALTAADNLSKTNPTDSPWQRTGVGIAMIDCSDSFSVPLQGVYRLSDIDPLFGVDGIGKTLKDLLRRFREEVQVELDKAAARLNTGTRLWLDFPLRLYRTTDVPPAMSGGGNQ